METIVGAFNLLADLGDAMAGFDELAGAPQPPDAGRYTQLYGMGSTQYKKAWAKYQKKLAAYRAKQAAAKALKEQEKALKKDMAGAVSKGNKYLLKKLNDQAKALAELTKAAKDDPQAAANVAAAGPGGVKAAISATAEAMATGTATAASAVSALPAAPPGFVSQLGQPSFTFNVSPTSTNTNTLAPSGGGTSSQAGDDLVFLDDGGISLDASVSPWGMGDDLDLDSLAATLSGVEDDGAGLEEALGAYDDPSDMEEELGGEDDDLEGVEDDGAALEDDLAGEDCDGACSIDDDDLSGEDDDLEGFDDDE